MNSREANDETLVNVPLRNSTSTSSLPPNELCNNSVDLQTNTFSDEPPTYEKAIAMMKEIFISKTLIEKKLLDSLY